MNENRTNQPHGIMFHHFYDKKHIKSQGAITAIQLEKIIEYYNDNLLSAEDWFNKAKAKSLSDKDICLTFDDALLCQYEIALPVLEKYNLTAFWFIYSSVLNGGIGNLEVYRKFRTVYFSNIEDFYKKFFSVVDKLEYRKEVESSLNNYQHNNWSHSQFFSQSDTKFRYVRDTALGHEKYKHVMDIMMENHNINIDEFTADLWMNVEHLQHLKKHTHIIGLHSHTHPTVLSKLSVVEQYREYKENFNLLHSVLGEKPKTVSHPCNSYNNQTLSILRDLNIDLGFRANMENHLFSKFEFPRENHSNIIRRIEQ